MSRADEKDDLKKELAALEGTWLLESAERNGGDSFPEKFVQEFKFVIAGDKLTIVMPGKELKSTFTIDPTKKPKNMDITTKEGGVTVVSPGLYCLDKDTLKVVLDE